MAIIYENIRIINCKRIYWTYDTVFKFVLYIRKDAFCIHNNILKYLYILRNYKTFSTLITNLYFRITNLYKTLVVLQ